MKILLGQLGSNGDCLYATTLARQIKSDYPKSELTWAISSKCKHLLDNNPYVDRIWEWPIKEWSEIETSWYDLENHLKNNSSIYDNYDRIILPQIWPNNFKNFDGTVRPSILRAYDREFSVPIDSVIELTDSEKKNVERFIENHDIASFKNIAVFECSSKSGQSYVTPEFALEVADLVTKKLPDHCFILTTHEDIQTGNKNIISAKSLTFRENLSLLDYATVFIGCGSGLTVVSTSSNAKDIPNIQVLSKSKSMLGSFYHDFEYFGKDLSRFVEMGDVDARYVADSIISISVNGLDTTKNHYHDPVPLTFDFYLDTINDWLIKRDHYVDALQSLVITMQRYGDIEVLAKFAERFVLNSLEKDRNWKDKEVRDRADKTMSLYHNSSDWVPTGNINCCDAILEIKNLGGENDSVRLEKEKSLSYKTYLNIIDKEIIEINKLIDSNAIINNLNKEIKSTFEPIISRSAIKPYNISKCVGSSDWQKRYNYKKGKSNKRKITKNLLIVKRTALKKFNKASIKLQRTKHLIKTGSNTIFNPDFVNHINNKYSNAIIICKKPKFSYLYNQAKSSFSCSYQHVVTDRDDRLDLSDQTVMGLSKPDELQENLIADYCDDSNPPLILCDVNQNQLIPLLESMEGKLHEDQELIVNTGQSLAVKEKIVSDWGEVVDITEKIQCFRKPRAKYLQKSFIDKKELLPKISIVTVSYNQARFIERCIKSIINQGYPNLEYIIIDGGSTDGTLEILEKYKNDVDVLISEPDEGQSNALNKGFRLATGDIMTWVCSDDELEPRALYRIGSAFNKYDADIIVGDCRVIDEENNLLNIHQNWLRYNEVMQLSFADVLSFCSVWHKGAFFYQPEVFFTREIWNKSGAYLKEHLYYAMDYDMFLRFALAGANIIHIPNIIGVTRKHKDQKTQDLSMEYMPTIKTILQEFQALIKYAATYSIKS